MHGLKVANKIAGYSGLIKVDEIKSYLLNHFPPYYEISFKSEAAKNPMYLFFLGRDLASLICNLVQIERDRREKESRKL